MNVLSLFDGISCGRVALERAGIQVNKYYASEIDKTAIKISQSNHKDINLIGDVHNLQLWSLAQIDLLLGGSPCQNFSRGATNVTHREKINCLTLKQDRRKNSGLIDFDGFCRYLTRRELELAQTLPEGYTDCVSYNQACKALGNGWTVDVIAHILGHLK